MKTAAAALAWELRHRHRWGFGAVALYLVALAAMRVLVAPGGRAAFDTELHVALAIVVPLSSAFMYFLAVFSFGLSGDIAARESTFPARLFVLPVSTSALVGWPMLYGSLAAALLWIATRTLAVWPSGVHVPGLWPVLLGPALTMWTQALTWLAYPLRGLRVIVAVLWLTAIDAVVLVAVELRASDAVMLAFLAPQLPLAYLLARLAVGRARRGEVPDWRGVLAPLERLAGLLPSRRGEVRSAAAAQTWLEWRLHGRSLPALVAIVLPFELLLLFPFRSTPVLVFEILVWTLLTPPFLASFVAASVSQSSPFLFRRPLTNGALIAAKFRATARSTAMAWLLVLAAVPAGLRVSGAGTVAVGWLQAWAGAIGTVRTAALVMLLIAVLVTSTWKQLVQSLYIGMSGRDWLVKGSVFGALVLLTILFPVAHWILGSKTLVTRTWYALPWIAAVLVPLKLAAAAWVAVRSTATGVISDRMLLGGAAIWTASVFALFALLRWIAPAFIFRSYFLMLVAILLVPLVRLSAAPLALASSRHR